MYQNTEHESFPKSREKILVVDDEKEIVDLAALYLENENFTVFKFYSSLEVLEFLKTTEPDLAVLDIMMPEMDGLELCREIRKIYRFPIIMLTAKNKEMDMINGLTLGADDYMTKPFLPLELVARVKAQLRRYKRYNIQGTKEESFVYKGLVLNTQTHSCTLNEKPLSLTPTEFTILSVLCQHKGSVVSSEALFHAVWKDEYYNKNNNTITVHIRHLREKMGDSFEKPKYIKTVWGCGYKIED